MPASTAGTRISVSISCGRSVVSNGPVKNSVAGIVRSPSGPARDELGVEREENRAEVARGVGVRDRAADRAAMAHLGVADVRGDLWDHGAVPGEHGVAHELGVPGERADRDPVAVLPHVAEVVEPADVDEHRRAREAQPEHGDQRLAAREQLRVVAREQLDRVVDRPGALVLEGGGDHAPARAAACTASTMLWYPVQRQRLPSSAWRISSSEGFGFSARSETDAITKPGVQ